MGKTINLNRQWTFTGPDGTDSVVDVPRTWNAVDGQDGGNASGHEDLDDH